MRKVWGGVLVVTGFIACPCHLPLTLALVLGALGGTGIGGFLADNRGLVYGVATGYFVAAVGAGWFLLSRKRSTAGATCQLPVRGQKKAPSSVDART